MVACTKYNVSFLLILVAINCRFTHFFVTSSSFFGGERKHSHFPKLQSEKVKILTSPSIFADVGTKITVMENILHAFSLDKTEPETSISTFRHVQLEIQESKESPDLVFGAHIDLQSTTQQQEKKEKIILLPKTSNHILLYISDI